MNRRLLFIGILALSFGAVTSLFVYRQLLLSAAPSRPEVDVIVAADDLQVGAKISALKRLVTIRMRRLFAS